MNTSDEIDSFFTQAYEDVSNNPEHKKHESEIKDLGRKIMEHLGSDRTLFLDYEKLIYLIEGYRLESAYKIGLREQGKNEN